MKKIKMQPPHEKHSAFALVIVFFAGLGGFLFGYLTAIISGALFLLSEEFSLSVMQKGIAVSIILIGALIGALFAGVLADRFGRRTTILWTTVLFILGTWATIASSDFNTFIFGRLITGIAVGIISLTAPLYLAEIAPTKSRGAFVSVNQLAICIGVLAAYLVNFFLAAEGEWRLMFGLGIFPAAIKLFGMFFLPESPAWLIAQDKPEKALAVLRKIRKDEGFEVVFPETKPVPKVHKERGWKELFSPQVKAALFAGIGISILQQVTGINTVIYYSPEILKSAGSSYLYALMGTVGIGVINVIAAAISVLLLDKIGRRPLLLLGLFGMFVSLFVLACAFFSKTEHIGLYSIFCLLAYVGFFSIGIGPIAWVVPSEIYPMHIRGKAMSVGVFCNWSANWLVSFTFLDLISNLGTGGTFLLYASISIFAIWYVRKFIPETKGKSQEEIEKSFQSLILLKKGSK